MISENTRQAWLRWASIGLVALTAFVLYYQDRIAASDLEIVPDSVEYAYGGHKLASAGLYEIQINGESFPPRYSPWFSLLFITPAYSLLGLDPGNAIIPVFLMAILGAIAACWIGIRLAGPWGGFASSLLVFLLPIYRYYARNVMTDVPASALILIAAALFLYMNDRNSRSTASMLISGTLCAIIISLKPAAIGVTIPFLYLAGRPAWRDKLPAHVLAFTLPVLLFVALGMLYNITIFGNAFRTGYHFWCPVPYDYTSLSFSLSYLRQNLVSAHMARLDLYLAVTILLAWFLHRKAKTTPTQQSDSARPILPFVFFALAAAIPLVSFHMIYFFPTDRFYLPVLTLLTVLNGALIGRLIPNRSPLMPVTAHACLFLLFLFVCSGEATPTPTRRLAAERIRQFTPSNAWVVTTIDPVYLDLILGEENQRRIIPLSANVEYADKVIAWEKIRSPNPPPLNWQDHSCPGLIKGGARKAITITAAGNYDLLNQALRAGTPLFLEASQTIISDLPVLKALDAAFQITPKADFLSVITPRNAKPSLKEDGSTKGSSPLQEISGTQTSPAIQPPASD